VEDESPRSRVLSVVDDSPVRKAGRLIKSFGFTVEIFGPFWAAEKDVLKFCLNHSPLCRDWTTRSRDIYGSPGNRARGPKGESSVSGGSREKRK
jgi:hypothetical protein